MKADWVECRLGEICEINMGQSPPSSTYNIDGVGLPFFQGKAEFTDLHPIIRKWCSKPKKTANIDDILISVRAPVGSTNIADQICAIGRGLAAVTYKYNYKFIWYYLKSIESKLDSQGTGTTFKAISGTILRGQEICLPPLLIQRAIVAKIEELFSSLDSGIADLTKAQKQLVIYRQAVLKKAFEGELTKEWREKQTNLPTAEELLVEIKEERQKYYEQQLEVWKKAVNDWKTKGKEEKRPTRISKPKDFSKVKPEEVQGYNSIPEDWFWTRFGTITYKIGDIDHKMPKSVDKGIPYISTGNIGKDGKVDFDNAKLISQEDFNRLSLKIKPEKGDIIFPRYGTIGRNILIDFDKEFLVSYSCAIIKNITKITNPKFNLYYSLSPVIKGEIKRYTVETTQANIGIASIESFVYPLSSTLEQHQIVREIESRLSVCDKVEESIAESLEKAKALRQSILKKAFEGKLLSEEEIAKCKRERDYEPAHKLLERIKAEKKK